MAAGDNIVERLREFMLLEAASEVEQLRAEIERLRQALRLSDACRVHAEEEVERLRKRYRRAYESYNFQIDANRSMVEAIGQSQDDNERLRAALTDIASDLCSASGAAGIAKDALAGKTREEWS